MYPAPRAAGGRVSRAAGTRGGQMGVQMTAVCWRYVGDVPASFWFVHIGAGDFSGDVLAACWLSGWRFVGDLLAICWRFTGDALPALAMGLRPSVEKTALCPAPYRIAQHFHFP